MYNKLTLKRKSVKCTYGQNARGGNKGWVSGISASPRVYCPVECPEHGKPHGLWGSHTQAWVQAAGIAVLSTQVRTVPLKLPGVSEVHHQGLHEARGREEVVALVAIVIPT